MNLSKRKFDYRKKKAIRKVIKKTYLALEKLKDFEVPTWYKYAIGNGVVSTGLGQISMILSQPFTKPEGKSFEIGSYIKKEETK